MAGFIGGISQLTIKEANHVRPKGAKESVKNRPIKHRASDKNRAPTQYKEIDMKLAPPVYTVLSNNQTN